MVRELLALLGVEDTEPWMEGLARAREGERRAISGNPYVGLVPYGVDDAPKYFGRSSLLDAMRGRIDSAVRSADPTPTILVGPSGSGKTSALQAGLARIYSDAATTVEYVAPSEVLNLRRVEDLTDRSNVSESNQATRVLVVDQVENLLETVEFEHLRRLFSYLETLASDSTIGIVMGLRGDYFGQACLHPYLVGGLERSQVVVPPLTVADLADCIVQPANAAGLKIDQNLVSSLVSDFTAAASDHVGASVLPLLSHVLHELASNSTIDGTLTLAAYEEVGGIGQALERSAEAAYSKLTEEERAISRQLFRLLVDLGEQSQPVCHTLNLAGLDDEVFVPDVVDHAIDTLMGHRLLTSDRGGLRITHEALLRTWGRLANWIQEDRELLVLSSRIRSASKAWSEADEEDGGLLRGSVLERGGDIVADPVLSSRLSDTDLEFVERSQRRDEQLGRLRRRRRRIATYVAVFMALLAAFAWFQSQRAATAETEAVVRSIVAEAANVQAGNPNLAAQLQLSAYSIESTPEAEAALTATSALPVPSRLLGQPGPTALAVSADGSRVAVSDSVGASISVLERSSSAEWIEVSHLDLVDGDHDVYAMAFSSDGSLLAYGGSDWYANLWDIDSGAAPVVLDDTLTNYQGAVQSMVFVNETSEVIAAGTSDGGIGRWGVAAGPDQSAPAVIEQPGTTWAVSVDAAGELLASGHDDGTVALRSLSPVAVGGGDALWSGQIEEVPVSSLALSPDGRFLVVGYRSGQAYVLDISDPVAPEQLSIERARFDGYVQAVRFAPDSTLLAIAGGDGVLRLWTMERLEAIEYDLGHPSAVTQMVFQADDLLVATADGTLWAWPVDHPMLKPLVTNIWTTSASADGRLVVVSSASGLLVWDFTQDGEQTLLAEVVPGTERLWSGESDISPDGSLLAIAGRTGEVWLQTLDDKTGESAVQLEGLTDLMQAVRFSADGSKIFGLTFTGAIAVWEVGGSTDPLGSIELGRTGIDLTAGPDDATLLIALDMGAAAFVDVSDPAAMLVAHVEETVGESTTMSAATHSTSQRVATVNDDQSLALWDVSDRTKWERLDLAAELGSRPNEVSFSPDGEELTVVSHDGSASVWSISSAGSLDLRYKLQLSDDPLYSLSHHPGGGMAMAGGGGGRTYLWDRNITSAIEGTCDTVGDGVTEDEWRTLIPYADWRMSCPADG